MQNRITLGGVVVAVGLSLLAFFGGGDVQSGPQGPQGPVGAQAGPEYYGTQYFYAGYQKGSAGSSYATSTPADFTFTAGDLAEEYTYVELNPTVGAITATFPATTTGGWIGNERGSERTVVIYNATTTTGAASVITFAAGTGVDLQEDEGETVTLNGLEAAEVTFIRKADSDVLAIVSVKQVGD